MEKNQNNPPSANEESCQNDSRYQKGSRLYRIGMMMLGILVVITLIMKLLGIHIVIGNTFCDSFLMLLYLIPFGVIIAGMMTSQKACRQYHYQEASSLIILCSAAVCFLLIGGVSINGIARSPYYHAEISEISLNSGSRVTAVCLNTADDKIALGDTPNAYQIQLYKTEGIFWQCLVASEPTEQKPAFSLEESDGIMALIVATGSRGDIYQFTY